MKIIITTQGVFYAARLKESIISAVKGEDSENVIDTWSYTLSAEKHDIIYHNLEQYTSDPTKNVLFKILIDGNNVVFSTCWWSKNPEPSHQILSLHVGRLIELLLSHYAGSIAKLNIVGF